MVVTVGSCLYKALRHPPGYLQWGWWLLSVAGALWLIGGVTTLLGASLFSFFSRLGMIIAVIAFGLYLYGLKGRF